MRLKKLPYQFALLLLTFGASLNLGFLSFGGMFSLWPILPLAFSAFVLSIAYEGEIYLQNLKGALNKLFKTHALEQDISKTFLLENFPDASVQDRPRFFSDYEAQLKLLSQFGHHRLHPDSAALKKRVEKKLSDMEQWFATQLFQSKKPGAVGTPYEQALQSWIKHHGQADYANQLRHRQTQFHYLKAFSLFAGLFMGLGTTYLLMEAFSVIPFFAAISMTAWPFMIAPMAVIAGLAYGLLTLNAVTDLVAHQTLQTWYQKLKRDLGDPAHYFRSRFMALAGVVLVSLAMALTVCTAGTWWTVAKQAKPLFTWMSKMPGWIMGVLNPIITGLSAVIFNLQNSSETLALLDERLNAKPAPPNKESYFQQVLKFENGWQLFNPFRWLLKLTLTPIRLILFSGHLISIGVTADRVPGVSQFTSALLGIISEGFEDGHYFLPHPESHEDHPAKETKQLLNDRFAEADGHSHDDDIPTRFLTLLFSPVYCLAAGWDYLASQRNAKETTHPNRKVLTFTEAWEKQQGLEPEKKILLDKNTAQPSSAWQKQQAIYRIERQQQNLRHAWFDQKTAHQKLEKLTALQNELNTMSEFKPESIQTKLRAESRDPTYQRHRFFSLGRPTATAEFLSDLPERIALGPVVN